MTEPSRDNILRIVFNSVNELNEELDYESLATPSEETLIYDGESALDSLSLVILVSSLEADINTAFNANILLASEKAMSMRNSPFRSIGSLASFIEAELKAA